MNRLPASLEDLRGLRARRYVRVSTEEQGTKYGPDRQHEEIDAGVRRLGLLEAGPAFVDEQSAWSHSDARPALRELVAAAAAGEYDVLVVAYFSRWSRDAELSLRLRRELHAAGVVVWFADEAFASNDDEEHERYLDLAVASEKYSHALSRTIRRTFKAKFERYGDQAGSPGLGFMRTPQPEARLAIDVETMPQAVALFERYAAGDLSYRELAAWAGMDEGRARAVLTNPLYNGWAVRHRRSPGAVQVAAPWRSSPPVSDELWARVVEVRGMRAKAAGRRRSTHVHLLAKLVWCECGRAVRADTSRQRNGKVVLRYLHQDCPRWSKESAAAYRLDGPIESQVAGIRIDAATMVRIRALAGNPGPPDTELRRAQLERELRAKAAQHAQRRLTTEAYLAEHARITAAIDELTTVTGSAPIGDVDQAIAKLRDIRAAWAQASTAGDEGRAIQAQLVRALYRRITVVDGQVESVALTEEAKRLGMAVAMPETVVLARPAGARNAQSTARIRIEGRADWLKASRSA